MSSCGLRQSYDYDKQATWKSLKSTFNYEIGWWILSSEKYIFIFVSGFSLIISQIFFDTLHKEKYVLVINSITFFFVNTTFYDCGKSS